MFNNFFRTNKIAMWLLTVLRVYVGYKWITAGWGKVTEGFDASGFINGAIAKSVGEGATVQGWWASFLQHVALPGVDTFNVLVAYGELLVGLGLILGTFTTFAALMGLVMNASYLLSGTVSTNTQLLLFQVLIVVAGANAGKIGFDYYVLPYLRKMFGKNKEAGTSFTAPKLKTEH